MDYGCGTGILTILARHLGAKQVYAIDIDKWAFLNTKENLKLNQIHGVRVQQGDIKMFKTHRFDLILANINKKVILETLPAMATLLKVSGTIILSGFYKDDSQSVINEARQYGLTLFESIQKDEWQCLVFEK